VSDQNVVLPAIPRFEKVMTIARFKVVHIFVDAKRVIAGNITF